MKNVFRILMLLLTVATVSFISCSKNQEQDLTAANHENPEIIDGVSQAEEIVPIDLNVKIVDGIMTFDTHDEMVNALDVLEKHNIESIAAWEKEMGFTSLFSDFVRIEELSKEEILQEINERQLTHIIGTDEEGIFLKHYNLLSSRIYNVDGLMGIGEFIGTTGDKFNVWTTRAFKAELLAALKTGDFSHPEFIVYDNRLNEVEVRDWTTSDNCPKDEFFTTGHEWFKNPDANRRIKTKFTYFVEVTPTGGGNSNYLVKVINESTSYKASWNKYKTNHYHSHDFDWTTYNPSTGNTNESDYFQGNNKKIHISSITIANETNRSTSWLVANGRRLVETHPGTAWGQGQSMSHRGMDGDFVRWDCD